MIYVFFFPIIISSFHHPNGFVNVFHSHFTNLPFFLCSHKILLYKTTPNVLGKEDHSSYIELLFFNFLIQLEKLELKNKKFVYFDKDSKEFCEYIYVRFSRESYILC
jgi:hypothetical protein